MSVEIRSSSYVHDLGGNNSLSSDSGLDELPEGVKELLRQLMADIGSQLNGGGANSANDDQANGPSGVGGTRMNVGPDAFQAYQQYHARAADATPAATSSAAAAAPATSAVQQPPDATNTADTTTTPQTSDATQNATLTTNADGVPQAQAISGVSPASSEVMDTGTGDDKTFNYTDDTARAESITYSVDGAKKGTMTLQPGETGTFIAGSEDEGVRISPSDAQGNSNTNEVLYEDGGAANGQAAGAGNPDVSKVDGDKDDNGIATNMTITLSDGRTAGDGDAIRAYQNPTDDAAAMGLAGDASKTVNIVQSDVSSAST
ncbi:hypothetical protein [Robbsia sp. KACC 23696]|uniref:hypothetical protein n=1 Tax=Robbsia sp. KACC 23696 TaxID=3149231 RepID=UPI00325B9A52